MSHLMFLRRVVPLLSVVAALGACGVNSSTVVSSTVPQIDIGGLPSVLPTNPTVGDATNTTWRTTTTLAPEDQVGAQSTGNRVIVIGDSVIAATSSRYSDDMCEALVPLGWQVEVDAETGRFVDFGTEVLDARLAEGWEASVILLGNNYRGNQGAYRDELAAMVDRLSPKPVVLLTVTEWDPSRVEVNEVILDIAGSHDNVTIVDWANTTAENQHFTGADHLHLTTAGRRALAEDVALALGPAPTVPGACLETAFIDDSSGGVEGTTTTTVKRPSSSKPTTTTSAAGSTTSSG
jgi:hypothetical protein